MRLLLVERPRLPLRDCELGSQMIKLFGRVPRRNRRRIPTERIEDVVVGGLCLVAIGVALAGLLFTF